jgi:hypothetical protein
MRNASADNPRVDPRNNPPSHADLVHEKVSHIAELLRGWGWSFSDLVRYWILHNDGARGKCGRGHQKRVNILRSLPTDSDAMVNAIVFGWILSKPQPHF